MANTKPKICGTDAIYIPDTGCDCCEILENKVRVLEECCDEVKEELDKKLEQHDILAGDNVSVSYNDDGTVTINSSGGGSTLTKTDVLTAMGYNEMIIAMTDTEGNHHSWRVMGVRVDANAVVTSNANVEETTETTPNATEITKQQILSAMGYTEFEMEMTDENDETGTWRIIGEQIN